MSIRPSLTAFGDQMGVGWKNGLQHKFPGDVTVHLNYEVKDESGDCLGKVDAIMHSTWPLSVYHDLFPTCALNIRPSKGSSAAASNSNCYVAEIKRSIDSGLDRKIDSFVRLYGGLFSKSLEFTKRDSTVRRTTATLLGEPLRNAVSNPNTKILFVFNGQDLVTVQTRMRQVISNRLGNEDMTIHGHQVICVWCDSSELIKWKEMMLSEEKDLQIQAQKRKLRREMQETDRILQAQDRILQEQDRLLQRLLEERADPGRITGKKRKLK